MAKKTAAHGTIIVKNILLKRFVMSENKNKIAHEQIIDDKKDQPSDTYKKLPDDPANSGDSISTADDTAGGKYSKTGLRKDEKDLDQVKGKE